MKRMKLTDDWTNERMQKTDETNEQTDEWTNERMQKTLNNVNRKNCIVKKNLATDRMCCSTKSSQKIRENYGTYIKF